MTTWHLLTATWAWDPSVVVGCVALLAIYGVALRPLAARALLFAAGVLALLLALVSPLDTIGDRYLFSAHMLQHLILVLVVPPLLLLGLPPAIYIRALHWRPARQTERVLGYPVTGWVLGVGTLWVWHLPALYDTALASEGVHVAQHLCFLVSATIFWWPVLGPMRQRPLPHLARILYLLLAGLASSVLGIIITLAPSGLYPAYLHPADPLGTLPLLRGAWGLSASADQQLGGLLMWIFAMPIYLLAIIITLARWYGEIEADDVILDKVSAEG